MLDENVRLQIKSDFCLAVFWLFSPLSFHITSSYVCLCVFELLVEMWNRDININSVTIHYEKVRHQILQKFLSVALVRAFIALGAAVVDEAALQLNVSGFALLDKVLGVFREHFKLHAPMIGVVEHAEDLDELFLVWHVACDRRAPREPLDEHRDLVVLDGLNEHQRVVCARVLCVWDCLSFVKHRVQGVDRVGRGSAEPIQAGLAENAALGEGLHVGLARAKNLRGRTRVHGRP